MMTMMKGWRTIVIGLLLAIAPNALSFLAGVDWTQYVGPNAAVAIGGVLMIAMRLITDGPFGKR